MVELAVVVIGPRAAGKTVLAEHLASTHELRYMSAGDIMRRLVAEADQDLGVSTSERALAYMRLYGFGSVSREMLLMLTNSDRVVVDGLRAVEEVNLIRRASTRSVVAWVEARQEVRFERTVRRARARDEVSFEGWVREEALQRDMGITACDPSSIADVLLRNEGTVREFLARASSVLRI